MGDRWITGAGSQEDPSAEKRFEANIGFSDYSYLVGNGATLQEAYQELVSKTRAAGMDLASVGMMGEYVLEVARTGVDPHRPALPSSIPDWTKNLPGSDQHLSSEFVLKHTVSMTGAPPQVCQEYDEATKRHRHSFDFEGQTFTSESDDSREAANALALQLRAAGAQADPQNPYDPIHHLLRNLATHEHACIRYPGGVSVPPRFDFRKAFVDGHTFEAAAFETPTSVIIKAEPCGDLHLLVAAWWCVTLRITRLKGLTKNR